VECSLLLDGQNVPIAIQETVVKWMNALVVPDELGQLVLADHAHALDQIIGII
jgi:hypothetical protein